MITEAIRDLMSLNPMFIPRTNKSIGYDINFFFFLIFKLKISQQIEAGKVHNNKTLGESKRTVNHHEYN